MAVSSRSDCQFLKFLISGTCSIPLLLSFTIVLFNVFIRQWLCLRFWFPVEQPAARQHQGFNGLLVQVPELLQAEMSLVAQISYFSMPALPEWNTDNEYRMQKNTDCDST
jgi:hypothetical protein